MSLLNKMWKTVEHNRFAFASVLLTSLLGLSSCVFQPKVKSPVSGNTVTRPELQAELEGWIIVQQGKIEAMRIAVGGANAVLDAQATAIAKTLETLSQVLESVPSPWSGILGTGLGLLSAGLAGDNLRKDKVIRSQKSS